MGSRSRQHRPLEPDGPEQSGAGSGKLGHTQSLGHIQAAANRPRRAKKEPPAKVVTRGFHQSAVGAKRIVHAKRRGGNAARPQKLADGLHAGGLAGLGYRRFTWRFMNAVWCGFRGGLSSLGQRQAEAKFRAALHAVDRCEVAAARMR